MKGEGNQIDYGMRVYDPRVGRFESLDPLQAEYPMLTPYQYAGNNSVAGIDLDGKEFSWFMAEWAEKKMFGTSHLLHIRGGFTERAVQTVKEASDGIKSLINSKKSAPIYGSFTTLTAGIPPGSKLNAMDEMNPGLRVGVQVIKGVFKDYSSLVKRAVNGDDKALGALGFEAALMFVPIGEEAKIIQGFKYSKVAARLVEGTALVEKEIVTLTKTGTRADALAVAKQIIGDIPEDAKAMSGKFGSQQDGVTGFQWYGEDGLYRELRLDYDPKKGAHYNWKKGKQKGAVQFNSSQEQVDRMIKNETIKSDKEVPKPAQQGN